MFKTIGKLAQVGTATALVESLLERLMPTGLFEINPTAIANFVVKATYEQDPSLFNGTHGPKPHRISFAALSLCHGLRTFETHSDEYSSCHAALGNLLMAMETEGGNYPLTRKDHHFLELSKNEYLNRETVFGITAMHDFSMGSQIFQDSDRNAKSADVPTDEELQRRKDDIDKRLKSFKR